MCDFEIERELISKGIRLVCGVDEVGRGALFGPVVAAAVILDPARLHAEIDDSKRLSPRKRQYLAEFIYDNARAFSVGWCWNDEIDRYGIVGATQQSMLQAIAGLQFRPDFVLLDALRPDFLPIPGYGIIHGDQKSMSVAAASIIAKVFRDQMVTDLGRRFPEYELAKNKGYPSKKHISVIRLKGRSVFHRESFKVKWAAKQG